MPTNFFSLEGYEHRALFSSCQYPWEALSYLDNYFKSLNLARINTDLYPNVYFVNPELIFIGEDTVVEPGAYVKGPCVLGRRCQVRHGAYVRGFIVAGDDCIIGHATEMKNSILLNGVSAAHFNYVGDCILGNHVNLGAGAICANLRLDRKPVRVVWENKKMETGRAKLGAIIGDHSSVGCHCVLNPGTLLKKNSVCLPCKLEL